MKRLVPFLLFFSLCLPAAHGQAASSSIEARLEKLERENAELRQQMSEMLTAMKREKASKPGASAEKPAAPTVAVSSPKLPAMIETRFKEEAAKDWKVGINPNGGGFFLKSPDDNFRLRLFGYAQAQFTLTDGANGFSFQNFDTRIRRARLDWIADFYKRYELFIEIDAAPLGGTSLVEARLNAKIVDDKLQLRLGKFTTPFSFENFRSSRAIDTIERYIALNAMFSVPALDVQTGGMIWGNIPLGPEREYIDTSTVSMKPPFPPGVTQDTLGKLGGVAKKFRPQLTYYAGIWNGNASASNESPLGFGGNSRDNNDSKEVQAKLLWQPHQQWTIGAGYDHNDSESGEFLTLSSLSGAPYIRTNVDGNRDGAEFDFLYEPGRFSLRGEGMYFDFKDADLRLAGGFLQAAYFIQGDVSGGLQPLIRLEHAELDGNAVAGVDGDSITAITAGLNWFLNGNVRFQINYIGEYFNGAGNANIGDESFRNTLLSQLQIKF
jgi:hypothetical protein